MLRVIGIVACCLITANLAHAQPGQTASPYAQGSPQLQLSAEDYELLHRGELSTTRYVIGGALGTWVGLGLGHAVQGRWDDIGYVFTLGESAAFGALFYGLASCIEYDRRGGCHETMFWGGLLAYGALRIWEAVDLWSVPPRQNQRVRFLRHQLGYAPPPRYSLYLGPSRGEGGVAGLTFSF